MQTRDEPDYLYTEVIENFHLKPAERKPVSFLTFSQYSEAYLIVENVIWEMVEIIQGCNPSIVCFPTTKSKIIFIRAGRIFKLINVA